jgi:hypothetical protein
MVWIRYFENSYYFDIRNIRRLVFSKPIQERLNLEIEPKSPFLHVSGEGRFLKKGDVTLDKP